MGRFIVPRCYTRWAPAACILVLCSVACQRTKREFTNSIGMKFVLIEPGTFMKGDADEPTGETQAVAVPAGGYMRVIRNHAEPEPPHKVTLTEKFYMQATEVTQRQWQAVMGNNPSQFKGPDLPIEEVSWEDVQEFLKKLNAAEKGARYRLPTEVEWEYSAKAGQANEPANLDAVAWYNGNSSSKTHPVGQKQPNAWGLYDMLGNVWEWVAIPEDASRGLVRGGSWFDNAKRTRTTFSPLIIVGPGSLGFRCVREALP